MEKRISLIRYVCLPHSTIQCLNVYKVFIFPDLAFTGGGGGGVKTNFNR